MIAATYRARGMTVRHAEGPDGTKRAFMDAICDSETVHLATHCVLSDSSPWLNRFILSPEVATVSPSGRDAWAFELRTLPVVARLVVCSVCASEGQFVPGEGLLGFARTFFIAGVPSVVGTLWPIDDALAPAFMVAFHRALIDGDGVAASLRLARKTLRERTADALMWAPFVCLGAPGTPREPCVS